MKDLKKTEAQRAKFIRLKSLVESSGWQDVLEIITDKYNKSLDKLKFPKYAKQEQEARGAIKVIEEIVQEINSEYAFGKVAQEQYVKSNLGQTPEGG